MSILFECEIPNPKDLLIRDPEPRITNWQGRKALRFSGQGGCLLVIPNLTLSQGWIEVDIASEGAAYPGIAFRILDSMNYELAYAQPHTSGKWDALQYDPVFHGSNTWQLYHGPGAQLTASVPPQTWFRLQVGFIDQRAIIQVEGQEPLIVNQLAHDHRTGLVGLWTYLPAYFANLCIRDDPPDFSSYSLPVLPKNPVKGTITEWFLEGFGKATTEPSGILNLNRYLPISTGEVRLVRDIAIESGETVTFQVGFSDELTLQIDEETIFQGENLFHSSPHWEERGYVSPTQLVSHSLSKGLHQITAILKAKEYFGFGMTMVVQGEHFTLLPANLSGLNPQK